METRTLGKIYQMIQEDFTRIALGRGSREERKRRASQCRKSVEIFKHDVCLFVDAEAEKACRLLEGSDAFVGYVKYPPE